MPRELGGGRDGAKGVWDASAGWRDGGTGAFVRLGRDGDAGSCRRARGRRCGDGAVRRLMPAAKGALRAVAREDRAQGTLEYALTVTALLGIVLALGALWRAGESGALASLVERAAPRALAGTGPLDIALF